MQRVLEVSLFFISFYLKDQIAWIRFCTKKKAEILYFQIWIKKKRKTVLEKWLTSCAASSLYSFFYHRWPSCWPSNFAVINVTAEKKLLAYFSVHDWRKYEKVRHSKEVTVAVSWNYEYIDIMKSETWSGHIVLILVNVVVDYNIQIIHPSIHPFSVASCHITPLISPFQQNALRVFECWNFGFSMSTICFLGNQVLQIVFGEIMTGSVGIRTPYATFQLCCCCCCCGLRWNKIYLRMCLYCGGAGRGGLGTK